MEAKICRVAVDAATYAIDKLYDYTLPQAFAEKARVGARVLVPFGRGNKRSEGIILSLEPMPQIDPKKLKPIADLLDEAPVLDKDMIKLAVYMRERLYCTFFDCIRAMLPAGLWFRRNEVYALADGIGKDRLHKMQAEETDEALILRQFSDETPLRTPQEIAALCGGRNMTAQLDGLCAAGILSYQSGAMQVSKDKTERMFRLALAPQEALERVSRGRSTVRMDVVSCLGDGTALSAKELLYMTGASSAVLRTMVKHGILEAFQEERFRTPDFSDVAPAPAPVLSGAQQAVYEKIAALQQAEKAAAALLFGVTGSGKTQVYIRLIADALEKGRGAILLVPEIGLTPQVIRLFVSHFGEQVAVMHSALSVGERYDSWKKIKRGETRVVIGTRSAVFAPVQNLGIIIMDEEQDSAYKSEQTPRYHTKDIAKYRVASNRALLLLGSATPSVETYYEAEQGKYPVFTLQERYLGTGLPKVTIADMRGLTRQGEGGILGPALRAELADTLENGRQAILFLNRRGNSRVIHCAMCGWVPECPSCSTTLTYHSANGRAMCHFCGHSVKIAGLCPQCASRHLHTETPGTQKVEEELHEIFPDARVLRMDADTTSRRGAHEKLLKTFAAGRADILLGTQMVTKGLDFEKVSLVGVLDADQSLYTQNYQAHERTFSLLTQVVGRAGRRFSEGKAVIQTFSPSHPVILDAARQDYESFYKREIALRGALRCPPTHEILLLVASGEAEHQVLAALVRVKKRLESLMEGQFQMVKTPVLGPVPAPVVKISGRYRYHLTMRAQESRMMRTLISGLLREFHKDPQNRSVALFADLNAEY